jgi:hypothetical protein
MAPLTLSLCRKLKLQYCNDLRDFHDLMRHRRFAAGKRAKPARHVLTMTAEDRPDGSCC